MTKKILKYIMIIILGISACYLNFDNLNYFLLVPFIMFCFYLGMDYFLFSLIGSIVGTYLTYTINSYYLVIAIIINFIIFFILKLLKTKSLINFAFSNIFSIFITYLFYNILNNLSFDKLEIFLIFSAILSIVYTYSLNRSDEKKSNFANLIITLIYLNFFPNFEAKFLLIFSVLLINSFNIDIYHILASCSVLTLINIVNNSSFLIYLAYIYPPILIINYFKNYKKYHFFIISNIYILVLNFLIKALDNFQLIIIMIFIFLISIIIPESFYIKEKNVDVTYMNYIRAKEDIAEQLEQFSLLFYHLSHQFNHAKNLRLLELTNENIFQKFCTNCPKYSVCYHKNSHLLINYLDKYLSNNLTENDKQFLLEKCYHSKSFLILLENFIKNNLFNIYKNDELYKLKDVVSEQFTAFSLILRNYKKTIFEDHNIKSKSFFKNLKSILEKQNIDIIYVRNFSTFDNYEFEIAVNLKDSKKIQTLLLPLIESILNCNMLIKNVQKHTISANYIILYLVEDKSVKIAYSTKQNCIDITNSGDYVNTCNLKNKFICALSDGMGYGFNAYEESSFTVNVIFNSLKSGIDCETSIDIANTLLKLKNHHDTYTTIDLISIDLNKYIATFYKAGASSSYLIRNNEINLIENYSLPIGIVDSINMEPYEIKVKKDDIIVMASDGIIEDFNIKVEEILKSIKNENIEIMTRDLFDKLMQIKENIDDATLVLIKIL